MPNENLVMFPGMMEQLEKSVPLDDLFGENGEDLRSNLVYYYYFFKAKFDQRMKKETTLIGGIINELKELEEENHPIIECEADLHSLCIRHRSDDKQGEESQLQGALLLTELLAYAYHLQITQNEVGAGEFHYKTYRLIEKISGPFLRYFKGIGSPVSFVGGPKISVPKDEVGEGIEKMKLNEIAEYNKIAKMSIEGVIDLKLVYGERLKNHFIMFKDNCRFILLEDNHKEGEHKPSTIVFNEPRLHRYLTEKMEKLDAEGGIYSPKPDDLVPILRLA